ncbi:MAG: transglycosylase SLT domain-containing protein [Pyrinomonadaceae bacterium]
MRKNILNTVSCSLLISLLFTVGCSAQQTEEQALKSLRDMTANGKLPPETLVADIESRFAGKRTGALAKLLHARIRFETGDFAGAAAILNSDVFQKKTKVADYAIWLRGKALQSSGNHAEALKLFDKLIKDFPDSIRVRDARLLWAASAIQAGRAVEVPPFLVQMSDANDADALLITAKAYEAQGSRDEAIKYYRNTYFYAAGSAASKEAEAKLALLSQPLTPQTAAEQLARADRLLAAKNYADAAAAYITLATNFGDSLTPQTRLRRLTALANSGKMPEAVVAFNSLPEAAIEREEAYRQLVLGYAKAKMWPQTRATVDEMRAKFPNGKLVAKTLIDAGLAARDAKNRTDEGYFLNTAVAAYPNAVEVAQAQFESAWFQHETGNYALSSQGFIDHLARYTDKDTTNRGKAGYWAARDSERSGKTAEACALYDGVLYRYGSNWYGYLAMGRLSTMKSQGGCKSTAPPNPAIAKAVSNLKIVTVVAETSTDKELARVEKSDELSIIGLFDWAVDELNEAKKTANNSPKINLALARYYRLKGDNTSAFVALAKSYPDYAQMFPEEMGREEWAVFYPLINWNDIKLWSQNRGLDRYQVAGLIRQESVFTPRAKSPANAYGLMQLLLPTARTVAKKYRSTSPGSAEDLFQPALNIELGTAFMKDQLDKFGRIEYVAVAYNAGPGRVPQWRATLPPEMDEFVEAIPFKETKAYVQGVIRNSAQYRRLYDDNGNFKANVGTRPLRGEIDTKSREQFTAEFPEIQVYDKDGE